MLRNWVNGPLFFLPWRASIRRTAASLLRSAAPLLLAPLLLAGCGEDEDAIMLIELQSDLATASSIIDSLNYQVDSVNLLLDEARARVDSLQRVDDKLLNTVQTLASDVARFKGLYAEQRQKNKQIVVEIQRLKVEKKANSQTIASLRSEADSLNTALLEAHTSIRRQSDGMRELEVDLAQTQDDLETLRRAQFEVRLLIATEAFLDDNGYLKASRPFGRGFRKTYKLTRKLNPADAMVRKLPINEAMTIEGELMAVVDLYGALKEGKDYVEKKEGDMHSLTFTNELLGGMDVLAIVKE